MMACSMLAAAGKPSYCCAIAPSDPKKTPEPTRLGWRRSGFEPGPMWRAGRLHDIPETESLFFPCLGDHPEVLSSPFGEWRLPVPPSIHP